MKRSVVLNSELYPPLKEQGFEIRSQGPSELPPLIDATRRNSGGRSEKFLIPTSDGDKAEPKSKDKPEIKAKEDKK